MAFSILRAGNACVHSLRRPAPSFHSSTGAACRSIRVSRPSRTSGRCPRNRQLGKTIRASAGAGDVEVRVQKLTEEIKLFELERDDATKTAETLAKTSVKLLDMIELLDKLALEKVSEGDEDAARNILKEKEEVKLMLDKTKKRAETNFALARKLAEAIGQKQSSLVSLLPSTASSTQTSAASEAPSPSPAFDSAQSTPEPESATRRIKAKWETSLEEAQARMRTAEQEALTEARLASLGATESIAAARARLEQQQRDDITYHRERLRRSAEQSIEEARERLKKQEEEALEEIKWLMRRYRNGDYVPDYQLDSAFDKLQRRMYK